MAGTSVAIASGDLLPINDDNGSGQYVKGRNNARDIRIDLLGSLFLSGPDGATPRDGVLIRSNGADDLAILPQGSPNQTVTLKRGKAIINRTGQGPYLFTNEADLIVPLAAASAVNSRIDLICLAAYDKGSFVGDALHGPYVWIEQGVVSGSPVVPATPAGMLAIASVLRATNDNTISAGEITSLRVSTAVGCGFRTILQGETAATPGRVLGETRYAFLSGPDVWDGAAWAPIGVPRIIEGAASSDLTLGTAVADIPGATTGSFTLDRASVVLIQITYDMTTTASTTAYCYGKFAIDGVTHARSWPARAIGAGPAVDRRGGGIQLRTTLAAGAHTIKLQGNKDINDGTVFLGGTLEVTVNPS